MPAKPSKALVPSKKTPPAAPAKKAQPLATSAANIDFEGDSRAGMESMGKADFQIPRLLCLQDLSPQVKKQEPQYIKGASAGQICDPITGTLWDGEEGVVVLPIHYRRTNIEWKPRAKGGGFVADHGPDEAITRSAKKDENSGKLILPNGNEISTVAEYFVFRLDEDGGHQPFVLTFKGADLKKSRRWNTMMSQLQVPKADGSGTFCPAMFFRSYKLTTVPERNDKGSWMGWNIEGGETVKELDNGTEVYQAAKQFLDQITAGTVKAQEPTHEVNGGGSAREDDAAPM